MNKILKNISNILLILLIVVLAGYFVFRVLGIVTIYKVETGSMETGIHAGDYILIINKKHYHNRDIITYKQNDYYITHRIVKVEKDKFITKGDANNVEDEPVLKKDVVGKVIYSGNILNVLIDYKFAIAGIMIAFYLVSCYIESRKKKTNE